MAEFSVSIDPSLVIEPALKKSARCRVRLRGLAGSELVEFTPEELTTWRRQALGDA